METADFVIAESARLGRPLDMRLLTNAFADRLQSDDHDAGCSWKDLVTSTLFGGPSVTEEVQPVGVRERKKAGELAVAYELVKLDSKERIRVWRERTKMSPATLYRRLAELRQPDALTPEK
jgi:hypothetical protein